MSEKPTKRTLSPEEKAGLEIVKNFERALDENHLTVTLSCTRKAAEVIGRRDGINFKVHKVMFRRNQSDYAITFDLPNYRLYMEYILPFCGLRLELDGSLTTRDNMTISPTFYMSAESLNKKGNAYEC